MLRGGKPILPPRRPFGGDFSPDQCTYAIYEYASSYSSMSNYSWPASINWQILSIRQKWTGITLWELQQKATIVGELSAPVIRSQCAGVQCEASWKIGPAMMTAFFSCCRRWCNHARAWCAFKRIGNACNVFQVGEITQMKLCSGR